METFEGVFSVLSIQARLMSQRVEMVFYSFPQVHQGVLQETYSETSEVFSGI